MQDDIRKRDLSGYMLLYDLRTMRQHRQGPRRHEHSAPRDGKRTATPERVTRVSAHIVTHETARGGLRLAAGVTV